MVKIICPLTLIPLRSEPDHRSEQVSQILFGERAGVIEEKQEWCKIVMDFDFCSGWIEKDSVKPLSPGTLNQKRITVNEPFLQLEYNGESIIVCAGSEIPLPDEQDNVDINGKRFHINNFLISQKHSIIDDAFKFINAPYLWGGRTLFGIDCSGFIQLLFKINGIALPRNTKDQVKSGIGLQSFNEIQAGDLAFFGNDNGIISHVGLYLGNDKIIHASKRVRIDRVDEKGIYREKLKKYTHKLCAIRRVDP